MIRLVAHDDTTSDARTLGRKGTGEGGGPTGVVHVRGTTVEVTGGVSRGRLRHLGPVTSGRRSGSCDSLRPLFLVTRFLSL